MYFTLASTKKFFSTPVKGRITIYPAVSAELQVTTSDVRQKETSLKCLDKSRQVILRVN